MRPFTKLRSPCGRIVPIGLGVFLAAVSEAKAQTRNLEAPPYGIEPRKSEDFDERLPTSGIFFRHLYGGTVEVLHQRNLERDVPTRCAMRRMVGRDVWNFDDSGKWLPESAPSKTAALRAFEIGFEQMANSRAAKDIRAFVRFRFERVADGTPLKLERPVLYFTRNERAMDDWTFVPLDLEGYGGAWIALDRLPQRDLWGFVNTLMGPLGRSFAVTLPEIGEERAYEIPFRLSNAALETFDACGCAMRNAELAAKGHLECKSIR